MFEFTQEMSARLEARLDAGLPSGLGTIEHACLVATVNAAIDPSRSITDSDPNGCMSAALRSFAVRLNDARWPSERERAEGLRELAFLLPGSRGLDDLAFAARLAEATIREIVPLALRAVAEKCPSHAVALRAAADRCEAEGTREAAAAASSSASAAYAAAASAAYAAAASAAYAAAYAAAADAADAAGAAGANQSLTTTAGIACRIVRQLQAEATNGTK